MKDLIGIIIWGTAIYLFIATGSLGAILGLNDNSIGHDIDLLGSTVNVFDNVKNGLIVSAKNIKTSIVVSGDNGSTFQKANIYPLVNGQLLDVFFSNQDKNLIFAGTDKGLLVSSDAGLNWHPFGDLDKKIDSKTTIYKVSQNFISTFDNGTGYIYKTTNNFFNVEKVLDFDSEATYDFEVIGNNLYLAMSNGRLMIYSLSQKEFRTLYSFNSPIVEMEMRNNGLVVYALTKNNDLSLSNDGGKTFTKKADNIYSFVIYPSNNSVIYASAKKGLIKSTDGGDNWQTIDTLPTGSKIVSALAVDANGKIYAASKGKIYTSRDAGFNWKVLDLSSSETISQISVKYGKLVIGIK